MSNKITTKFFLRPFTNNDYKDIVDLRNSLYPDHPKTVKTVRHRDLQRKGKIKQKRFVFKTNNEIIVCAGYEQYIDSYHPQKFVIYIHVNHHHQNMGYGSSSFNFLMNELKQFNPIKITSIVSEIHKKGIQLLENRGFSLSMKECESSLDLDQYNPNKYYDKITNGTKSRI